MCFYYAIHKKKPEKLIKAKVISKKQLEIFTDKFIVNAFNFPAMPVITSPGKIELIDWGLIPHWVKNKEQATEIKSKTLNAMSESVFEKPSFAVSVKQNRCLVLSSGFFEWLHLKGKTFPHFISLADDSMYCMAGIWSSWTNPETDSPQKTFSILTTQANALVGSIHSKQRMPVILKHEEALKWITEPCTPENSKDLFTPFPENEMKAHPVQRFSISDIDNLQTEQTIHEYSYTELNNRDFPKQLSLF